MITKKDIIKEFWEAHPLCAYEIPYQPGTVDFFKEHDRLKLENTEKFNMHIWELDYHKGDLVLDVGCGPGWLVQEYSQRGAEIVGVDLTWQAISLTKQRLNYQVLKGALVQADAESLPFRENTFDFISCSGVLRHTPNTLAGIHEIHRILKPGHKAVISLYYRSFIFNPIIWSVSKRLIYRLYLKTGFRNQVKYAKYPDDFIKLYDGDGNPLGKAYTFKQVKELFSCFSSVKFEIHYFPRRFLEPFIKINNTIILKLLDKFMGTMLFGVATK